MDAGAKILASSTRISLVSEPPRVPGASMLMSVLGVPDSHEPRPLILFPNITVPGSALSLFHLQHPVSGDKGNYGRT